MPRPKDKRPAIRNVVREAGVSYGTISRVLNRHLEVAPATRLAVGYLIESGHRQSAMPPAKEP